jgi:hypothetical protein
LLIAAANVKEVDEKFYPSPEVVDAWVVEKDRFYIRLVL